MQPLPLAMNTNSSFGSWLKTRRENLDLTQDELAQRSGYTADTIRKIEANLRRPSKQAVEQFITALHIPADLIETFSRFARGLTISTNEQAALDQVAESGVLAGVGSPFVAIRSDIAGLGITAQALAPFPNLPFQPTAFVGRTEELAEIIDLLDNANCRLLTLVGPGGIGKTRLASEAAARLFNRANNAYANNATAFPTRLYFVPLQPLTSPDFILSALAEAIGFQFYPGAEPLRQMIDFLCPLSVLLIFDNFEHIVDGVGLVSDILASAPNVKILATSRETLNLQEEWLYQVKGMPFPEAERADLARYDAVQLFVQSARRTQSDFSLDAEQQTVLRICQLVEGMPLALEMTAAWLKRLPIHEIIKELEQAGLDILESPARNVPDRHRSMRTVFDYSWQLLTNKERDVFKKLSVFRGGFRKEAAQAVAGASLATLSTLVDKSLLHVDTSGRYDLHELLRQYAEERLNVTPEVSRQTHDSHCQYYAEFMAQRTTNIVSHFLSTVFAEVAADLENVRSAWEWAVRQRALAEANKIGWPLSEFYSSQGLYQEGKEVFGKAADSLRDTAHTLFISARQVQGRYLLYLGHYQEARDILEGLLGIAHERQDSQGLSVCLHLSEVALQMGDYQNAKLFGEEYLAWLRQREQAGESVWVKTFAFAILGRIAYLSGDYAQARDLLREAIAIAQKFDIPPGIIDARHILGNVELASQAYANAKQIFMENLALQGEVGYRRSEVPSLIGLGEATRGLGAYHESRQYFSHALRIALQINGIPSLLNALTGIAALLQQTGDQEQALQLLALVLHHHAADYETKMRAKPLLTQLAVQLSSDVAADAIEQGKISQLDVLVQMLLDNSLSIRPEQSESLPKNLNVSDLLTERELEILRLIADGLSNDEIAKRLFLALSTIKWHIAQLYSKLDVASRTQAIVRARKLKLLI